MNSLKNDIAVTILTDALAGVVKDHAGQWPSFIRLKLNPRDFACVSPEILYLDPGKQASFVPRAEINPTSAAKIVSVARELADSIPRFPKPSAAPSHLRLEAKEIDGRWLVNVNVATLLTQWGREVESTYRFRTRYAPRNRAALAA